MDRSLLPEPDNIVVDKENNEWVLTYSANDDQTTLKLRLNYRNRYGPNPAICEIREQSDQPFGEVGRLMFAPVELDPDCWNEEPDLIGWPTEWRPEFVKLARVWTACTALAEWGSASGDRQAELEAKAVASSSETPASNRAGSDR